MRRVDYIKHMEDWKADFRFNTRIRVRFSETDMFGHMNNTTPFIYFEEARIGFLKSVGLFNTQEENPASIPMVADLQADFHVQLFFDDVLDVYVKANQIGSTSFDLHYLAINQRDEVSLTGRGRMVQVNPQTGKPVPLSDEMKEKLSKETTAYY